MANLRIELGGRTVTARLEGRVVRVGRDPECDLAVDDPSVAAVHVTFEAMAGGGHKLTDANSGRPTKVNGVVVKRVALRPGDVIEVGPARLTYLADDPAAVAPAAPVAPPRPSASAAFVAPAAPRPAPVAVAPRAAPRIPERVASDAGPAGRTQIEVLDTTSPPEPVGSIGVGERPSRARSGRALSRILMGLGVFAIAALGIAYAVRHGGDGGEGELKAWREKLEAAEQLVGKDVDLALARLDELTRPSVPLEGIRREARRDADGLRARIEAAGREYKALEDKAGDLDPDRIQAALRTLKESYGEAIAKRFDATLQRATATYRDRASARGVELAAAADALLAKERFGPALAVYDAYEAEAAWNEITRKIVDEGRQKVGERAGAAWKDSAEKAAEIAATKGAGAAATWLRDRLVAFAGTPYAKRVAERAATYDGQASPVATAPASTPATARPAPSAPSPGGSTPSSTPAAPALPTPAPTVAATARLEGLLADADVRISARKWAEALAVLDEALKAAQGGPAAARVAALRADVASAIEGVRQLAAAIGAHPERFERFEMTGSFTPSLVAADDAFVDAIVAGGRTRLPWTTFDAVRLARLVERARLPGKTSVPLAALLHATGAEDAAERVLARFLEDGGEKALADSTLARWRGEPEPAGGYVAYAGRLVAPAERDRLVLEARVTAACAKVTAKDAPTRKAAYEELLGIGAPAKDAFAKALRARRAAAVAEVTANKTFTSGRVRQRLVAELEKRREAALALIEDAKAYPYPYTQAHEGQAEVDKLVDQVREVWERPFDLVATWEKGLTEAMALVAEVDEVLGKVEEGYAPDVDAVKAAINKAIDVPGLVPDETSKKVLAYNEKVATSATPQEKDNVRAVNEYRMMMGRTAVKIDERLERGARGHSIEMRLKGYFAHESPTPGLESPGKRCAREGYGSGVGENIAFGVTSGRAAFDGWFHSSGHHRNMINKGWTEMGCGRSGPGHWTQCFGGATGHGTKEPDPLPAPRADVAPEPEGPDGMPADPSKPADAPPSDPAMGG